MSVEPIPATLAGLDAVARIMGETVLVLGVDVEESPELRAIRAVLPRARYVSLSDLGGRVAGEIERVPKSPFTALRRLAATSYDAVLLLNDYRNLELFSLALRARARFVIQSGAVIPLTVMDAAKKQVEHWVERTKRRRFNQSNPGPLGPGNDYGFIENRLRSLAGRWPRLTASVIVPVYNRRAILEKTLAGLAQQDYPRDMFEVIIADDGSHDRPEELLPTWSSRLNLRIVRQEDQGYRLAAVRNLAAHSATGDILISLDCDMLPVPGFVASHMAWFHVWDGPMVVIGYRRHVNTDHLSPADILRSFSVVTHAPVADAPSATRHRHSPADDWRRPVIRKTNHAKNHPAPYAVASGGNLAYRRSDVLAIGGHDASFDHWGGEDDEFGYRMERHGAYFIPEDRALAYHQDHLAPVNREEHRKKTRQLLGQKVPYYRHYAKGLPWESPLVSIYIPAYNAIEFIGRAIDSALNQTLESFEVCVCDDGSSDDTLEFVQRQYEREPRVRIDSIPHGGTGRASNHAVSMCRGEFILQLDADDELLPEAARVLSDVLRKDPTLALVYGGYEQVDAAGIVERLVVPPPYEPYEHLRGMVVTHPRMFRIRDFSRAGGWDESLPSAEDLDLSLRLAEQGHVRSIPRILYRYWIHGENHSIRHRDVQRESHTRILASARLRRRIAT